MAHNLFLEVDYMKSKKFLKRLTALATSAVMIASCVTTTSLFASAAENSWELAAGIAAELTADGVFKISGVGEIPDYAVGSRPYEDAVSTATSVIIEENITSIGKFALANFKAATNIDVAKSVTTIGQQAFNMCNNTNLVIDIKGEVTSVGTRAFNSVKNTAKIYVYNQTTYDNVYASLTASQKNSGMLVLKSDGGDVDLTPQKEALKNVIEETEKNYPEWYYTEESYTGLKETLASAKKTLEKDGVTADDLTEAYRSVNRPTNLGIYQALVSKIQAAIDEAKKVDTSSNTASTAAALAEAIQKAQEVSNRGVKTDTNANGADQAEVTAAIEAITTAKDGLKEKASAGKVSEFEDHYFKAVKSNTGYTADSWAEYEKVLEEYLKVYEIRNTEANDDQIDAAMKSLDDAKAKLVESFDYTEYEKAKKAVKDFLDANAKETVYTTGSLEYIQSVYDYQVSRVEENGEYKKLVGQATINNVTDVLKNIIDPSSDSLVLKGDVTNLAALVDGCKDLIESDYTSDSWKTFTTAKEAAEALVNDPDNAGVDAIAAAEEALKKAIDTIVINYSNSTGDEVPPIGYIQKNGATLVMDKGTANDELAGTAKVRIVFDCAADVSFNPYAAIEIKAVVAGVESYEKFAGTDGTETSGTKNWIVELALTNPIASGNSYEISGFTYAWNNASDYVYAITKVEYLDAEGNVLKTVSKVNDTEKLDDFNEAVANAKSLIASNKYTEDSIKALEEAVAKADTLLTDSNGRPLPSKMSVIEEEIAKAIEVLVELPKGNISGTVVTPNANDEVTVTVATADGTEVAKATATNGEYTVSDLEDGEYIITFAAEGYVTRNYKATVAGSDITLEAEIHIVGDINGDGTITTVDVGLANAHAKGTQTLEEYDFEVAEVSGDDMITTVDVGIINSTAKGA